MAGGRDLGPRAPRWLNWVICSSGLTSGACFIWRVLLCEGEGACVPVSAGALIPRLIAAAVVPLLLVVTLVGRAARRLLE